MGTAAFAVPSLRALVAHGHEVPLVISQPDRPGHRLRMTPPAVKMTAEQLGLPVFQPERIRDLEAVATVAEARPELMVVVAYGQIIPRSILELPPRGILNVHASLLPRHRGAAPIAHAILSGDDETGVSIMVMDELLDHGPVLTTRSTPIGSHEDAASLGARLADIGSELLVETIADLDRIEPRQQDHARASIAGKLSKADGELAWEMSAIDIDRRVRAFQPWPGCTLPWGVGPRVKVLRGEVGPDRAGGAGALLAVEGDGVLVATGSGSYRLLEVQLPGRVRMSPRELPGVPHA